MLKNPEKFGDSHDPFLESMGQVLQPEPTCAHSWVPHVQNRPQIHEAYEDNPLPLFKPLLKKYTIDE